MIKIVVLALVAFTGTALELTPDNWDSKTTGKTVFIKFFAPWCGHCKSMKPAWDSLMDEYASSETILVADVDCVGDGKSICEAHGVKGFPTIRYGDPANLEAYQGGRDLSALQTFASELKPECNVDTLEHCDEGQKTIITVLNGLSEKDLQGKIDEYESNLKTIEDNFQSELAKLQATYETLSEKKETDVAAVKRESNIGLVKSTLKMKETKSEL